MKKSLRRIFLVLFLLPLALHAGWWLAHDHAANWHSADWSSAHLLPAPRSAPEASIHVYVAPTGQWKGIFAVHSWIVIKEKGAPRYTRFDVAGWGQPVKVDNWAPDARWFGSVPQELAAISGPEAERLIPRLRAAIDTYRYRHRGDYMLWPGPNSNTFVATVLAAVPEAGIVLPANAIGKDWRGNGFYAGSSPAGDGVQVSMLGLLGLTAGWRHGIEVNVLSLVAGLDWSRLAVKLPGWGDVAAAPLLGVGASYAQGQAGAPAAAAR